MGEVDFQKDTQAAVTVVETQTGLIINSNIEENEFFEVLNFNFF